MRSACNIEYMLCSNENVSVSVSVCRLRLVRIHYSHDDAAAANDSVRWEPPEFTHRAQGNASETESASEMRGEPTRKPIIHFARRYVRMEIAVEMYIHKLYIPTYLHINI